MNKLKGFYESKYFNILLFLLYFVIPFIVYHELFQSNMVPFSGDGVQYFSMKAFINSSLKAGELPLWNPFLSNGVPFAGDLNGAFYPISILFSFLPVKWYIYCYYSFHLALGALFTYLYLKEINCDKFVAICTSFIYLFSIHLSGYRKSHMVIIASVVFLPIILFYIEKYIKTNSRKYLVISSIVMATTFLGGGVQINAYTDIIAFIYLTCRMYTNKIPLKKIFINVMLWGMLYLGIAAVQLIPTIELIKTYTMAGAGATSYESFLSYSIHPIKLIMMLFPNMFGVEVNQALGANYSSELDIEIFLGVGVALIIIFAIIKYFNDNRVRMATIFMVGTFIFASNAHVPVLNKIIYQTPVLGGFRCSGRALYIFVFFGLVLFALSLSKLKENDNLLEFSNYVTKILVIVCSVLIITVPFIYILSVDLSQEILKSRYAMFKLIFMIPIVTIFFILIGTKILKYIQVKRKGDSRLVYILLSIMMLILTVVETSRFSMVSHMLPINEFKEVSSITKNIKDNIGNNKLWLANINIDGGYRSIIEFNSNVAKEIPTVNAYIAFNNPRLFKLFTNKNIMQPYYNYSGLLTGFPDAINNLALQNDLISMLGIKYILDPQLLITDNNKIYDSMIEDEVIYKNESIQIPNQSGELYVFNDKIKIDPNTYYKISFATSTDYEQASFYADFAGSGGYDNPEQNRNFVVSSGENNHETLLNSGNSENAEEVYFRFVANPLSDIKISNLKITKMEVTIGSNVYVPFIIDETNRVFENKNVKDILYTPSKVVSIKDVNEIYNFVYDYDLDDVSYVENYKNFKTASTDISDIKWKRNSITAKVIAEDDTFINFSQNYYPGWKAYVDGKRTDLYMVNGLIQGMKISGGEHTVAFKFIPSSIIFGAAISIITLLIAIILIRNEKNNKKMGSGVI